MTALVIPLQTVQLVLTHRHIQTFSSYKQFNCLNLLTMASQTSYNSDNSTPWETQPVGGVPEEVTSVSEGMRGIEVERG